MKPNYKAWYTIQVIKMVSIHPSYNPLPDRQQPGLAVVQVDDLCLPFEILGPWTTIFHDIEDPVGEELHAGF